MVKENKINEDSSPKDVFLVDNLETLKVLSDPLRMQILELLLYQPRNVKQIAEQLGLSPNKLYYHVKLLEEHGLIRVVGTRLVSGIIEKVYRGTAKEISLDRDLLPVGHPVRRSDVEGLLISILDSTKEDLIRSLKVKEIEQPDVRQTMVMTRDIAYLKPEQAQAFCQKLREMAQEFCDSDLGEKENEQRFALTMIFYPAYHRSIDGNENG